MSHANTGELILSLLSRNHAVTPLDIGADARLSGRGITFETRVYTVEGVGHLCLLSMKAMLGLMRMETTVLSTVARDMPLMNMDWVSVAGKQTLMGELYDTQLAPWPEADQAAFQRLSERDADLPGMARTAAHWYDLILYPCSYHRAGRGIARRLEATARDFAETFVDQLAKAPACDAAAKGDRIRAFAENLVAHGGPAVDQVTKLFGPETARRLILHHMYGV